MTTKKDKKTYTVNAKFDADTKQKLEILAFIRGLKLQSLIENIVIAELDANADAIADGQKLLQKYNK